jgi:D-3-phosphoglycerate dehydrogenase
MLASSRFIVQADKELRNGLWNRLTGLRLGESIIGIIGLGRVGTNVIKLLKSFKPKLLLLNDNLKKDKEIENIIGDSGIKYKVY